jgi:poly-beta-1,6-N-acetyl-D-glucosamine synthase
MKCSIGIPAYNEEKNIGHILTALLDQETEMAEIDEIFVIASGCTDRTLEIAQSFTQRDPRIQVLVQEKREGKASAINYFLHTAKNDMCIVESADTIPEKKTVEYLIRPFEDTRVGMAGAHPVPVNKSHTLMGFTAHLLWTLHHHIALQNPKMGEMIAFRKIMPGMPRTSVDEAYLESVIRQAGYELQYVPEAIVYNKGPEIVADFFRQRRHIHWGHLHLQKQTGYAVSTASTFATFEALWKQFRDPADNFLRRHLHYLPAAIALETCGRMLGYWDYYISKKEHIIWDARESTKHLRA